METKHTKNLTALEYTVCDVTGPIATTYINTRQRYIGATEAHANAKLFAAAPDLLEALTDILKDEAVYNFYGKHYPTIEKAKAAIKKATE